ncbi:MAG TPA: PQ-loop domain-containing transporter [Kribbella sp.]|nr:PQ-loop domain-containing transporter [Kribbella sp.]
MLDFLPIVAACFGIPQYVPQILKLRRTGDTAGVSWSWATLTSINNAAWFGYFMASGYWTASLPSTAAAMLSAGVSILLVRRGALNRRAIGWIVAWAALLVFATVVAGRLGLGTMLAAASIVQVTPSLWTAFRTTRPTGISAGTWGLVLGELSCWFAFGLWKTDPRLITLGATGVVAAVLMLSRARQAHRSSTARTRRRSAGRSGRPPGESGGDPGQDVGHCAAVDAGDPGVGVGGHSEVRSCIP